MAALVRSNRVTRQPPDPLLPSWSTGQLAGRAEVPIVSANSPDGSRWWSVYLDALTGEWDGQAYGGSAAIQGGASLARVRFGDGLAAPAYVSWPSSGGVLVVYGRSVEVTALPLVSSVFPLSVGPSWAATVIGDDVPPPGNRETWLGLCAGPEAGILVGAGATTTVVVPPYARACVVGDALSASTSVAVRQDSSNGAFALSRQDSFAVPLRVILDPRAARVRITNTALVAAQIQVFWEIAI